MSEGPEITIYDSCICCFCLQRDRCKRCGKLLRKLKGLAYKDENGWYCLRQPSTEQEVALLEEACRLCPFQAIIKLDRAQDSGYHNTKQGGATWRHSSR